MKDPQTSAVSSPKSRRDFLRASAAGSIAFAAATSSSSVFAAALAKEGKKKALTSETLVTQLYKSLTPEQSKDVCFKFDHKLRHKVDNNWHITKQRLNKFFTPDQQDLIKQIFMGLHSEQYAKTVWDQVAHDSGKEGFFGGSSLAMFGEPGSGKFEFVLTGRHCTRRCDGDSVEGTAFGGPIFYGHAAQSFNEKPDHPGNAYWYQAKRANEVFQALDEKQRKLALLAESREEIGTDTVELTGKKKGLEGIRLSQLSADQKGLVKKVLADVMAPYRQADAAESMKLIEKNGYDNLHMAFFKNQDVGKDGVWDVWQIEGPAMIVYFRGDPHVHAWIHVKDKA